MKATITILRNRVFINFFNSKEVYSIKGFDTVRKAKNYANKCKCELFENIPLGVGEFQYCD
jgi:hypothetical protein